MVMRFEEQVADRRRVEGEKATSYGEPKFWGMGVEEVILLQRFFSKGEDETTTVTDFDMVPPDPWQVRV
jgi:hypothetical protein